MVKVKNTQLTNHTNEIIYPETSTDQIVDKETGQTLDRILKDVTLQSKIGYQSARSNTFYLSLEDMGLRKGTITIDDIAMQLPAYSTVIHSKSSNDGYTNDIFPASSGLLVVSKGLDGKNINFTFDYQKGFYKGYFNSYYKDERRWTGWNKIDFKITKFEQIGLRGGSETIKNIYKNLPNDTSLTIEISGNYGNQSIYPVGTGILEVSKLSTRAFFTFHHEEGYYVALYNSYYTDGREWRGWTNLYPKEEE